MNKRQKKKEIKKQYAKNAALEKLQNTTHFTIYLCNHYVTKKILRQYKKQGMKIIATGHSFIHTLQDIKKFNHPFTCSLHKMNKIPSHPCLYYDKRYKTYIKRKNQ